MIINQSHDYKSNATSHFTGANSKIVIGLENKSGNIKQ